MRLSMTLVLLFGFASFVWAAPRPMDTSESQVGTSSAADVPSYVVAPNAHLTRDLNTLLVTFLPHSAYPPYGEMTEATKQEQDQINEQMKMFFASPAVVQKLGNVELTFAGGQTAWVCTTAFHYVQWKIRNTDGLDRYGALWLLKDFSKWESGQINISPELLYEKNK
ncbi:MAG: hypothetical protein NXY57DRAFT_1041823 [Lentinula lateritia]|uniref:Uncharacterized protein n=1 Tax=Lentinula lateritia TaxID=40482 RepID=A0ABQ8V6U2_9AGAR|nr:MAG: hypothetical protein NXY57DRAFT_1041823 [Lentinula lateritia]KAJ4477571.1 hypothetical protein C8R41DRAFT_844815 [Lentinula lateritia]